MKRIGKHNPDVARMVLDSEQRSRAHGTKVAIVEEDREDEGETASASIHVGGARGQQRLSDEPLEKQKIGLVNQLIGMNQNIRQFSEDMEGRLEKAYKAGNYGKKFGYEGQSAKNMNV